MKRTTISSGHSILAVSPEPRRCDEHAEFHGPAADARRAMAREAPVGVVRPPQAGVGWLKVATDLGEIVPPEEMESIWLFAPVRHEDREWGTAVISRRAESGRRRIYTASYIMVVGGPERGQHKVAVEEVGEGPEDILHEVIAGVQERAGDSEPPLEILPQTWYGDVDDESATEG